LEPKEEPRIVTDTLPVAALRCNAERRFVWVNATYAAWLGRRPAEIVGRRLEEILGTTEAREIDPLIARALFGEEVQYERMVDFTVLGRRWIKWVCTPMGDAHGGIDSIAVVGIDIQAQKDAERRKDEFLATLAHELRNPLAPIRNAVAILGRKGPQDPEVAWSQAVIERQIEQLSRLIDDLLDIERISRGKFVLRKERVALEVAIDMALEASRPHINAAGHHLSVLLPSERVIVDADPARLAQVFSTLLKNAARHMQERGTISLTATADQGEALVTIEDSGAGMDSGAEPGVGLTLVRGILELHTGTVELRKPASGNGTEVLVRLPLAASGPMPAARRWTASEPAQGRPLRVLVADDNRDAADSLQRILVLYGHEVRVAYDGESAVRVGAEFHPRVAILDIGMPGTNGYDVARVLRSRQGRELTLVALTGWGQEADRRRATEAGFDHHLTKPVDPDTVNTLLAQVPPK